MAAPFPPPLATAFPGHPRSFCSTRGRITYFPLPMTNINTNSPKAWIKSKLWKTMENRIPWIIF